MEFYTNLSVAIPSVAIELKADLHLPHSLRRMRLRPQTVPNIRSSSYETSHDEIKGPDNCAPSAKNTEARQAAGGRAKENTPTAIVTTPLSTNSKTEEESSLSQALRLSFVPSSVGNNAVFLPVDKVEALICPFNVRQELLFSTTLGSAARDVCALEVCGLRKIRKNRKKIFAILALSNKVAEITSFIATDICDDDLPLKLQYHPHGSPHTGSLVQGRSGHQLDFIGHWEASTKELFDRYQWIVNAPRFCLGRDHEILHHVLAQQTVLPFTVEGRQEIQEGGFGEVHRVIIHKAHYDFRQYETHTFAIKRLYQYDYDSFKQEAEALKHFGRKNNAHLVNLLATYEHDGRYCLVFPWAVGGDLRSFWERSPNPPLCTSWVLEQLHGLATALHEIHYSNDSTPNQLYGRHGDIKPENILCFGEGRDSPPVLKFTDLGLAQFHSKPLYNVSPSTIGGTAMYRAPETSLPSSTKSHANDIWSFGCVLLEMASWLVHGHPGVVNFQHHRFQASDIDDVREARFFDITRDQNGDFKSQINRGVVEWFEHLRDIRTSKDEFTSDLLDLIEQRLLVVNPKLRADAKQLLNDLNRLKLKGDLDIEYFRRKPIEVYMVNTCDSARATQPSHQEEPPGRGLSPASPSLKRKPMIHETATSQPSRKRLLTSPAIIYGCPYRKHDPLKFNIRDFSGCALAQFPSISMVKRHVLKDHQAALVAGDGVHQLSQHIVSDNMERVREVNIEQRLRTRRANDQVLDWESLWKVLFPWDIDIPPGGYEPIIEHHEVKRAFSDSAYQGKNMLLKMMNDLPSNTSSRDLEAHTNAMWDSIQSYIQEQLRFNDSQPFSRDDDINTNSGRATRHQSHGPMPIGIPRQRYSSTCGENFRRLAPRTTHASASTQTSELCSELGSVPSLISNGPSSIYTLPSLPESIPEWTRGTNMHDIYGSDYPKADDDSPNPDLSIYDWTVGLGDFDVGLDFEAPV